MKKLRNLLKNDLFVIIFTAAVTTFFNYSFFNYQQRQFKAEKIFELKIEFLNKMNPLYLDIVKLENEVTFLDFEYDRLYSKYTDSLKLEVLPYDIHENLKKNYSMVTKKEL